ncbi:hypothetical protein [Marisediminicola sp. LYQ134]|uniref:glycosyltransferase family 39 protein n=1 Tax=Marisediminicola sp. LYQ134 TaxID=3391061 RepID=UPI0039837FF2
MTDLLKRADERLASLSSRVQRHPALAPVAVGVLALVVSLVGITTPSIWYDEAATITAVTRSWPELWLMLQSVDAVHGAYYVLIHAIVDVVGYSPFAIRAPSAVATGVTAALTVLLARHFTTERLAVLAGVVFCLLPRATWMGIEARSYAMSALFAVLVTLVFVIARRSTTRAWWVVYGVTIVVGCLFFIYLALVVVAHAVTMVWWLATQRREAVPVFRRWLAASAASAVAILPFAATVVGQSGQLSWIDPLSRETVRYVFRTQWFYGSTEFAIAGWALMILAAIALFRRARGFSLIAVVVPLLIVPTASLLVATELYSPIYSPRYLVMCIPFVAILMAAAVAAIPSRPLIVVTVASLVALAVPSFVETRLPEAKQESSWSEVAQFVADERRSESAEGTTAIIYGWVRYHPTATSRVIAYSYPAPFDGTVDVTLDTPAGQTGQLWETFHPLEDSLDRLDGTDVAYLITSVKRDLRDDTAATLDTIGWEVTGEWSFTDVNVVRYEPGAPESASR